MPTTPVSATVDLVGVPAIISAKENPKIAEMYNKSSMAAIDGMPIVKIGRRKGLSCDRCAAPDIMGDVFAEGIKQGKTHYFYGGKDDEVLEKFLFSRCTNAYHTAHFKISFSLIYHICIHH